MEKNKKNFQLVSVRDIAAILSMHTSSIYSIVKNKNFPKPVMVGKSKRWYLEDVEEWLLKNQSATA